jgi:hypothetical protein
LIFDMTAIRDISDEKRERHGDALKLLGMADGGRVEVATPPQVPLADLQGNLSAS